MELGEVEDCSMFSWFSVSSGVEIEQNEGSIPCIDPSSSSSAIFLLAEFEEMTEAQRRRKA